MNIKHIAILGTLFLLSCGNNEKVLHVYNWTDYINNDILLEFEQKTGAKIIYDTYASNEDLLAKLQIGASEYDVIFPSDYMISIMIEEKLISKLDKSKLPYMKGLDPKFTNLPYNPGNTHSVPYAYGITGIGYNATEMGEVDSWEVFWNPKYAERLLLLDDMREVFGIAFKRLGYSLNDTIPAHLNEAMAMLVEQKRYLKKYESSLEKDLLLSGDALAIHSYSGDVYQIMEEDSNLAFCVPKEGATLFAEAMCIPEKAPHKDLAYEFINFMLQPEIAGKNINEIWYAMPIPAALPFVDEEIRNDTNIFPSPEIMARSEFMEDLGNYTEVMERAWSELKVY